MSPGAGKIERRKKSRNRPPSLIYVELGSANGGMMRDLSDEGFALRAMMPLRAGEKTPFSFLLNDSAQIAGEGEILWVEENGRVAGIRFTEISAGALEKVHAWLSGKLESRKDREAAEKSANSPAPNLAQLREEIRSGPAGEEARGAGPAVPPPPVHGNTPHAPEVRANISHNESISTDSPAPASIEAVRHRPQETVRDLHATPDANPATGLSAGEFVGMESAVEPLLQDGLLPDISEVLIQPHGHPPLTLPSATVLEPLSELQESAEVSRANWMERFTLSRAMTIMTSLALLVGVSMFHREVGGVLISLGEAMGGGQESLRPPPASNAVALNSTHGGASSKPEDSSPPAATLPEPVSTDRESASGISTTSDESQSGNSATARNVIPPVTPLSGIGAPAGSDAGQETGQAEYLHAMQLVRGQSAGADMSEAVRLLWISVQKGNPTAEVALADLFWHGQGVAHNCDQTRILLSAAARKGSAEAQRRLQQFQREGCE